MSSDVRYAFEIAQARHVFVAGAYTHTSVAIRDALVGVSIPFIELHISNVHQREAFRHHSYLSDQAVAVICGLGIEGYRTFIRGSSPSSVYEV